MILESVIPKYRGGHMKKRYIVTVIILIIGLWLGSWYFIPKWYGGNLEAGTFGDMFGAVNALFSGLAFVGLIYTILVQREELKEQRKSIAMQTEELSLQRQAIEMQTEEMKGQKAEAARSADQLERQQQLMNYQLTLSTVNDLIKLKNIIIKEYKYIYVSLDNFNQYSQFEILVNHIIDNPNRTLDKDILRDIKPFVDTYFFLLHFIEKAILNESMIDDLEKIVKINTTKDEVIVLYRFSVETTNREYMDLLKSFSLTEYLNL